MLARTQTENPLITPIYKSYYQLLAICINASLSAFFFGYSLVYIGSLSSKDFNNVIIRGYEFNQIDQDKDHPQLYKSLINGAVPVGAIFGALLSSQIIRFFSRRNGFLITNIPAVISIVVMVYVKNPYVFIITRVIQGTCTGIYIAIVPLYINQIVTPDCTNLGSLNQIFIAFAQFFCFFLAFMLDLIFEKSTDKQAAARTCWVIIAQFPIVVIVIQSIIFCFVFPYQTPKYLYENGLVKQAADLISIIYSQDHTQQALARYTGNPSVSEQEDSIAIKSDLIGVENPIRNLQSPKTAIFFAIHLALLQQMSGVNAISVYGKNTLEQAIGQSQQNKNLISQVSLVLYAVSVIAAILTIKLMNKWGRKFFIQLGTLICGMCLGALAISFFFKDGKGFDDSIPQSIIIIGGMWIYMAAFGLTLGPIVWLYIPEIVEPNVIPYSTMTNLFGTALCIIGFPLIPQNKDKPEARDLTFIPFTFFFVWCLISLFINQYLMVETKNKPRQKIFDEYKNKKIC